MLISTLLFLCFRVNIKKDKCAISLKNLPGHPFFARQWGQPFFLSRPLAGSAALGEVKWMLLGEVKFLIYNPPASFRSKFQGYRTAEFTGAHTVLGHLVQEAFKSPQSVDSQRAISGYISWCLRVWFLVTWVLPARVNMTFLGLVKPETQGKWAKKLKKLCNPP